MTAAGTGQSTPEGAVSANALAESEQRLQSIIDNTTAVIFAKDTLGRYILANRRFQTLFGRDQEEIIGKTLFDLFSNEVAERTWQNDLQVLTTGQPLEFEEVAEHSDGMHTYISVKFPLLDTTGKPYAVCGISTDITGRKRAEAAAEKARCEAEKANRTKSEFLSRMSHELRTPLNAILGFAQLLETDVQSETDRESVSHILVAGRHLLELINEVLDISRIEANKLAVYCERVPLAETIVQLLELMRPMAQSRQIVLSFERSAGADLEVVADRQRLNQVLLNLLSNAIKFNRPEGSVTVSCTPVQDRLRISVRDTGIGIREDLIEKLFSPFERLDADRTGVEGSGLGLALSKRLVELMGGTIGVDSVPGNGSHFWIELPRPELKETEAQPKARALA